MQHGVVVEGLGGLLCVERESREELVLVRGENER
jgi:hypothetical protein